MLVAADILFYILHLAVVLFNILGWIWKKTLRAHIIFVGITLFSWLVLGIWYGFGYCFLTDWHWDIKRKLGETDLPASFITYFFHSLGIPITPYTADMLIVVVFGLAVCVSVYLNFKQIFKKRPIQ